MDVIPAIDLLAGSVVRLRQGRYDAVTVYEEEPARIAERWRATVRRLHVVDLDGARQGAPVQPDLVARLVEAFGPGVQVGGGIRTQEAVEQYLETGVDRVVLGTQAVRDPQWVRRVAEAYPERVVVAVDAKGGRVATDGWKDVTDRLAVDLVRSMTPWPIAAVLYTDIERDGTEVGPNVAETARLARDGGKPVIASGGVGKLEHLRALSKAHPMVTAAIVGRALHEERFSLVEAVEAAGSAAD